MQVTLISHASVIIETGSVTLWTDPWLFGKAFNESWALFPEPAFDEAWYDKITHIWVSHEHPDHFHVPTLRAMPEDFKKRVIVLFQDMNSEKMYSAFERFGFPNVVRMPHRKIMELDDQVEAYCFGVGNMDSALGLRDKDYCLVNINDAECQSRDCQLICKDFGRPDVVLNQFSLAGYGGFEDREKVLRGQRDRVMKNLVENSQDLGCSATIPFASFVYFCTEDNLYMNDYANTVVDVEVNFAENHLGLCVLYPGESVSLDSIESHDTAASIGRFQEAYAAMEELAYDKPELKSEQDLAEAFEGLKRHIHAHYSKLVLRLLKPVKMYVVDLDKTYSCDIRRGAFTPIPNGDKDMSLYSQPLFFAMKFPFGVQTLGVSARMTLHRNFNNWFRHRVLFAMNNAEIYLSFRHFFTAGNFKFLMARSSVVFDQILYKVRRHRQAQQGHRD